LQANKTIVASFNNPSNKPKNWIIVSQEKKVRYIVDPCHLRTSNPKPNMGDTNDTNPVNNLSPNINLDDPIPLSLLGMK